MVWLAWLWAAGYRIAGVAVNAASGQPVADARVTLVSIERPGQPLSAVSGEDGHFAFSGLAPGKYELSGRRRGLLPAKWPGAIVTGPGQDTGLMVLRLPPPGAISGKVMDDAGEPVAEAYVQLIGPATVEGRQTDDIGEYRFSSLAAGSYYLAASGVPWYTKFNETLADSAPRAMTHAGYAIRYYPNAADPAGAEALILQAGQDANANFTLPPVPAVSVEVHCEQFENLTKHYTLMASGFAGRSVIVRQGSETGDLYNLWGVPAGRYTLRAEAADGKRTWYGLTEFDAGGDDTEVEITLREAPSLSGMVSRNGGGSLPAHLWLDLRDESGVDRALPLDLNGRFSTPALPPGRYRASLAGGGDYDLKCGDGETLEIPPGAAMRLNCGAVPR